MSELRLRFPHSLGRERARLAGRIRRDAEGIWVADAFARTPLAGSMAVLEPLAHGSLVELDVDATSGSVQVLSVLSLRPAGPDGSDVARFVDGGMGRNVLARQRVLRALRKYFEDEGFVEVDTPRMVPSPGLDLHLSAFEVSQGDPSIASLYLITSPEYQMKRLLVGGVPRCFQFAPCFRREEHGVHHNAEFTMLEWYRSFEGVEAVIADTEQVVLCSAQALGAAEVTISGRKISLTHPFARITLAQAFSRFANVKEEAMLAMAHNDEERFFRTLVDEVEPELASYEVPVFLTHYPKPFASLARQVPGDPRYAERFELYLGGIELCNGFGELTDPVEQLGRFESDQLRRESLGLPKYPIDWKFVAALESGLPDSAGNALGLDRLLAALTGAADIADAICFPVSQR